MKNPWKKSTLLLLLLVGLIAGCRSTPPAVTALTEKLQAELQQAAPAAVPQEAHPHLLPAPDPVSDRFPALTPLAADEEDNISVEVLDRSFDTRNVSFTVLLRNTANKGVRCRVYTFGYDSNDRLISSTDHAIVFQPHEQILQTVSAARTSGATRWVVTVR